VADLVGPVKQPEYQYLRKFSLQVANRAGDALDLSELHCKFSTKRSDTVTPNMADIRIYNLSEETAATIKKEFTRIILQAGYDSNFGVIFQGNIVQSFFGHENATDSYFDILACDGDRAYNYAVVAASLAAGSSATDHANEVIKAMNAKGLVGPVQPPTGETVLSRGKVLFGNARDYLMGIGQASKTNPTIQDERLVFIPKKGYLPGEAVVLTSKTGMIGNPVQTNEGVNLRTLLNPMIKIGGRVKIDNKSVERLKINLSVPNSPANIPAPLTADGVYYVLVAEHTGDTRGQDWYSNLITLNIDVTSNPVNSVQVGYGGP
jgi:hypothetical protein